MGFCHPKARLKGRLRYTSARRLSPTEVSISTDAVVPWTIRRNMKVAKLCQTLTVCLMVCKMFQHIESFLIFLEVSIKAIHECFGKCGEFLELPPRFA